MDQEAYDALKVILANDINKLNEDLKENQELFSADLGVVSISLLSVITDYNLLEQKMNLILSFYFIKPNQIDTASEILFNSRSMLPEKVRIIKAISKSLNLENIFNQRAFDECIKIRNIFVHSQYLVDRDHPTKIKICLMNKHLEIEDIVELFDKYKKYSSKINSLLNIISERLRIPFV